MKCILMNKNIEVLVAEYNVASKFFDKIIEVSKKVTFELISTQPGDRIIITGGYPFKAVKSTNFMKIEEL